MLIFLQSEYAKRFSNIEYHSTTTLSYFVETTIGGDWGKEAADKTHVEEVVCIRGADIPEIAKGKNGVPPTRFILSKNLQEKRLSDYDIIIEISGGSPTQSTGRSAIITNSLIKQYAKPIICTNFCRAIKCKSKEYAAFFYCAFSKMYNDDIFFNYENGTTGIKNLDLQSILDKEEVYLPTDSELKDFFNFSDNILSQIVRYKEENNKLNELKQLYLKKFFG